MVFGRRGTCIFYAVRLRHGGNRLHQSQKRGQYYHEESDGDSCIRKYNKFYPDMRLEKVFNDILGFRMLTDSYTSLLEGEMLEKVRIVDMSHGKAKDDGYRGVHIYFQPDHFHYPIEIQANTYYDRQLNNWLHKYLYKREYPDSVGRILRSEYESGKILSEQQFEEVLSYVLSHCERI